MWLAPLIPFPKNNLEVLNEQNTKYLPVVPFSPVSHFPPTYLFAMRYATKA
jgi:hypothetical protein